MSQVTLPQLDVNNSSAAGCCSTGTAAAEAETTAAHTADVTRFHLSLNVADLERSIGFFERVFGEPPVKRRPDYAKFEPDSPPLVLSLAPQAPVAGGALNHAGFRFPDLDTLLAVQARLEQAGFAVQREEQVECCYARQTKFWVRDPDDTLWEFYVLQGDLGHRGSGQSESALPAASASRAAQPVSVGSAVKAWEHLMMQPFDLSGIEERSLDEVRLRGSFNVPVTADERLSWLKQSYGALKPGGGLMVHVLTTDETLEAPPQLPGGAAYVRSVPPREELLAAIEAAGFEGVELATFRPGACFEQEGKALRETKVTARRPMGDAETGERCVVVFKGPFRELTDDAGRVWRRGKKMVIPRSEWKSLETSSLAASFVLLPDSVKAGSCGQ